MTIEIGAELPEATLFRLGERGIERISSRTALGSGRIALFGVPGAFTPTCTKEHLPGYVARAARLRAAGIERIVCVSVNDPYVLEAWARASGAAEEIEFLADATADFARALGLERERSELGLGVRCRRFAALLEGGRFTHLAVEPGRGITVCGAEHLLDRLGLDQSGGR